MSGKKHFLLSNPFHTCTLQKKSGVHKSQRLINTAEFNEPYSSPYTGKSRLKMQLRLHCDRWFVIIRQRLQKIISKCSLY